MKKSETIKLDSAGRRPRKYRTPEVKAYGNIRDITQTIGQTGGMDSPASKTSP